MITRRSDDQWSELFHNREAVLRALTDWAADILTVIRMVPGLADLTKPAGGHLYTGYWHAEQLCMVLIGNSTGSQAATELTPDLLAQVAEADRDVLLSELADEYAHMLYVLNRASGAPELNWLASSFRNTAYWHAERAHTAVLTLLSGSKADGRRLHELWSDNHQNTAYNLRLLAAEKRHESITRD